MPFPFIMCIINENNIQVPCKLQAGQTFVLKANSYVCKVSKFTILYTPSRGFAPTKNWSLVLRDLPIPA